MSVAIRRVRDKALTCVALGASLALASPAAGAAAAEGTVTLKPQASKLPGGTALENLTNGAAGILLMVCLLGMVIGAGVWGISHHAGNPHHASRARAGVLVAIAAAVLITAAPALINFASGLGSSVK